ncbi:MAG TPA: hypothetical protein VGK88_11970 [bacterium]|jgi:hypothetical protein
MESSSLNHLHSQQLFDQQLRDAEQHRLARAVERAQDGSKATRLGKLRGLFESARRVVARPSLTATR